MGRGGAVIVARHGERIDYYLRDAGSNWVKNNERKWDPPLTHRGQMQARKLGGYLHTLIEKHDLPPIEAAYTSPMIRCCMTAGEAVIGYNGARGREEKGSDADADTETNTDTGTGIGLVVEEGLVESMNDKWYRSWGLPDSDGTWGGPGGSKYQNGVFPPEVDNDIIDQRAKGAAHLLVRDPNDSKRFLEDYRGHADDTSLAQLKDEDGSIVEQLKDSNNVATLLSKASDPVFSIKHVDYQWGEFESRKTQQDRMENVVETLSKRHPNGTILLCSHGAPVTQLYDRLTGNDWTMHGVATYTAFSIYAKNEDGADSSSWKAIVTNDSTHVKEMNMEAADGTTSFV